MGVPCGFDRTPMESTLHNDIIKPKIFEFSETKCNIASEPHFSSYVHDFWDYTIPIPDKTSDLSSSTLLSPLSSSSSPPQNKPYPSLCITKTFRQLSAIPLTPDNPSDPDAFNNESLKTQTISIFGAACWSATNLRLFAELNKRQIYGALSTEQQNYSVSLSLDNSNLISTLFFPSLDFQYEKYSQLSDSPILISLYRNNNKSNECITNYEIKVDLLQKRLWQHTENTTLSSVCVTCLKSIPLKRMPIFIQQCNNSCSTVVIHHDGSISYLEIYRNRPHPSLSAVSFSLWKDGNVDERNLVSDDDLTTLQSPQTAAPSNHNNYDENKISAINAFVYTATMKSKLSDIHNESFNLTLKNNNGGSKKDKGLKNCYYEPIATILEYCQNNEQHYTKSRLNTTDTFTVTARLIEKSQQYSIAIESFLIKEEEGSYNNHKSITYDSLTLIDVDNCNRNFYDDEPYIFSNDDHTYNERQKFSVPCLNHAISKHCSPMNISGNSEMLLLQFQSTDILMLKRHRRNLENEHKDTATHAAFSKDVFYPYIFFSSLSLYRMFILSSARINQVDSQFRLNQDFQQLYWETNQTPMIKRGCFKTEQNYYENTNLMLAMSFTAWNFLSHTLLLVFKENKSKKIYLFEMTVDEESNQFYLGTPIIYTCSEAECFNLHSEFWWVTRHNEIHQERKDGVIGFNVENTCYMTSFLEVLTKEVVLLRWLFIKNRQQCLSSFSYKHRILPSLEDTFEGHDVLWDMTQLELKDLWKTRGCLSGSYIFEFKALTFIKDAQFIKTEVELYAPLPDPSITSVGRYTDRLMAVWHLAVKNIGVSDLILSRLDLYISILQELEALASSSSCFIDAHGLILGLAWPIFRDKNTSELLILLRTWTLQGHLILVANLFKVHALWNNEKLWTWQDLLSGLKEVIACIAPFTPLSHFQAVLHNGMTILHRIDVKSLETEASLLHALIALFEIKMKQIIKWATVDFCIAILQTVFATANLIQKITAVTNRIQASFIRTEMISTLYRLFELLVSCEQFRIFCERVPEASCKDASLVTLSEYLKFTWPERMQYVFETLAAVYLMKEEITTQQSLNHHIPLLKLNYKKFEAIFILIFIEPAKLTNLAVMNSLEAVKDNPDGCSAMQQEAMKNYLCIVQTGFISWLQSLVNETLLSCSYSTILKNLMKLFFPDNNIENYNQCVQLDVEDSKSLNGGIRPIETDSYCDTLGRTKNIHNRYDEYFFWSSFEDQESASALLTSGRCNMIFAIRSISLSLLFASIALFSTNELITPDCFAPSEVHQQFCDLLCIALKILTDRNMPLVGFVHGLLWSMTHLIKTANLDHLDAFTDTRNSDSFNTIQNMHTWLSVYDKLWHQYIVTTDIKQIALTESLKNADHITFGDLNKAVLDPLTETDTILIIKRFLNNISLAGLPDWRTAFLDWLIDAEHIFFKCPNKNVIYETLMCSIVQNYLQHQENEEKLLADLEHLIYVWKTANMSSTNSLNTTILNAVRILVFNSNDTNEKQSKDEKNLEFDLKRLRTALKLCHLHPEDNQEIKDLKAFINICFLTDRLLNAAANLLSVNLSFFKLKHYDERYNVEDDDSEKDEEEKKTEILLKNKEVIPIERSFNAQKIHSVCNIKTFLSEEEDSVLISYLKQNKNIRRENTQHRKRQEQQHNTTRTKDYIEIRQKTEEPQKSQRRGANEYYLFPKGDQRTIKARYYVFANYPYTSPELLHEALQHRPFSIILKLLDLCPLLASINAYWSEVQTLANALNLQDDIIRLDLAHVCCLLMCQKPADALLSFLKLSSSLWDTHQCNIPMLASSSSSILCATESVRRLFLRTTIKGSLHLLSSQIHQTDITTTYPVHTHERLNLNKTLATLRDIQHTTIRLIVESLAGCILQHDKNYLYYYMNSKHGDIQDLSELMLLIQLPVGSDHLTKLLALETYLWKHNNNNNNNNIDICEELSSVVSFSSDSLNDTIEDRQQYWETYRKEQYQREQSSFGVTSNFTSAVGAAQAARKTLGALTQAATAMLKTTTQSNLSSTSSNDYNKRNVVSSKVDTLKLFPGLKDVMDNANKSRTNYNDETVLKPITEVIKTSRITDSKDKTRAHLKPVAARMPSQTTELFRDNSQSKITPKKMDVDWFSDNLDELLENGIPDKKESHKTERSLSSTSLKQCFDEDTTTIQNRNNNSSAAKIVSSVATTTVSNVRTTLPTTMSASAKTLGNNTAIEQQQTHTHKKKKEEGAADKLPSTTDDLFAMFDSLE